MALETLKEVGEVHGSQVMHFGLTKEEAEAVSEETLDEASQEDVDRMMRENFIHVDHTENTILFKIQNGPIKEVGVNGCQADALIGVYHRILRELNDKFPCRENAMTLTKLEEALMWQKKRTQNREKRGVEGTSQK